MRIYKCFSLIIILMIAFTGIATFPFLGYSNYDGDLTRMGMLPEKHFGWTAPQPKIEKTLLISSNWIDADVLVIGDSFSEKLIWQSRLVQAGYKVRTENWASIGQICNDFNDWLNLSRVSLPFSGANKRPNAAPAANPANKAITTFELSFMILNLSLN
jgi:hypothetical protein